MKTKRIRPMWSVLIGTIISSLAMAPSFGNFNAERLPILLLLALVLGTIFAVFMGVTRGPVE